MYYCLDLYGFASKGTDAKEVGSSNVDIILVNSSGLA